MVAPVDEDADDITVDRYTSKASCRGTTATTARRRSCIWLVGGEDDDVDAFLDAIENPNDESDESR